MRGRLLSEKPGQALVEVLVAISVLTVGFLGIVTLLSRALSLSRVVSDNYTGTYLAAEGIEIAKNIIDANHFKGLCWNCGLAEGNFEADYTSSNLSVTYDQNHELSLDPASHRYSYVGSVPTPFVRRIGITFVNQEEIKVESEVHWTTRGSGESDVKLEDHFYNWR